MWTAVLLSLASRSGRITPSAQSALRATVILKVVNCNLWLNHSTGCKHIARDRILRKRKEWLFLLRLPAPSGPEALAAHRLRLLLRSKKPVLALAGLNSHPPHLV